MHQDRQTLGWPCRLRTVVREDVSEELTTEQRPRWREGTAGRKCQETWQLRVSQLPGGPPDPGPTLTPQSQAHSWPGPPASCRAEVRACPFQVPGTCFPHSPCRSHQPPPLPGVSSTPGPEHIKVVTIVWAGGGRALARVWGSLKQNPGGGTRVTLQPGWAGDGWQSRAARS